MDSDANRPTQWVDSDAPKTNKTNEVKFVKNNKCPLCGNKMKNADGERICQECGYRASYKVSSMNAKTAQTQSGTPPQSGAASGPVRYSYEQDHAPAPRPSRSVFQELKRIWNQYRRVEFIISIFIILLAIGINFPKIYSLFPGRKTAPPAQQSGSFSYNTNSGSYQSNYAASNTGSAKSLPESDLFCQFSSTVFHKNYEKITPEDLEKVTAMKLSDDESGYQTIEYTLQNGESGTFRFNNTSISISDLTCFTGLERLDLGNSSLGREPLNGLDKLNSLHCANTPAELARIINPGQLTELGLHSSVFLSSLNGIDAFSNLSRLYADCSYITDISAVSALKKLTTLELTDGDQIENFQVLYDLTRLESLSIDSKRLRDISFISNMSSLSELSIQNSSIMQIDALADRRDTLRRLDLSYNYQVTDYQIVSQLSGLTDLTLFINYTFDNQPLPELGNMPGLTRLSIGNYDNFSHIADAPGLTELTICDVYTHDFSALKNLSKLTSLHLHDMSLEPSALEPLMELSQLKTIDLSDSFIWGNVEGLLKLPSLKEFNMNDCTAGLDMGNLTKNESLKELHMSHVTLKALENGQWDYNANNENNMNLTEHTEMFQYYPNLTELYLAGNKLEDISFAKDLSKLKVLDITNNYVASLVPLAGLSELEAVMCATNSIVEDADLGVKLLTKD